MDKTKIVAPRMLEMLHNLPCPCRSFTFSKPSTRVADVERICVTRSDLQHATKWVQMFTREASRCSTRGKSAWPLGSLHPKKPALRHLRPTWIWKQMETNENVVNRQLPSLSKEVPVKSYIDEIHQIHMFPNISRYFPIFLYLFWKLAVFANYLRQDLLPSGMYVLPCFDSVLTWCGLHWLATSFTDYVIWYPYCFHIITITIYYCMFMFCTCQTLIDRARQGALFVRQGLYKGAVFKPHPQLHWHMTYPLVN